MYCILVECTYTLYIILYIYYYYYYIYIYIVIYNCITFHLQLVINLCIKLITHNALRAAANKRACARPSWSVKSQYKTILSSLSQSTHWSHDEPKCSLENLTQDLCTWEWWHMYVRLCLIHNISYWDPVHWRLWLLALWLLVLSIKSVQFKWMSL